MRTRSNRRLKRFLMKFMHTFAILTEIFLVNMLALDVKVNSKNENIYDWCMPFFNIKNSF